MVFLELEDIPANSSFMKVHTCWKSEFGNFKRNKRTCEKKNRIMFDLFFQHCFPELEVKLESIYKWVDAVMEKLASMMLLNMVSKVCHQHENTK